MVAEATSSDARGAVEVAVQTQSVSTEGHGEHQESLSASDSAVDGVNPSGAVSKSHLGVFANTHDHKLAEPVAALDLPTYNISKTGISLRLRLLQVIRRRTARRMPRRQIMALFLMCLFLRHST
jgi:hypothetical protein